MSKYCVKFNFWLDGDIFVDSTLFDVDTITDGDHYTICFDDKQDVLNWIDKCRKSFKPRDMYLNDVERMFEFIKEQVKNTDFDDPFSICYSSLSGNQEGTSINVYKISNKKSLFEELGFSKDDTPSSMVSFTKTFGAKGDDYYFCHNVVFDIKTKSYAVIMVDLAEFPHTILKLFIDKHLEAAIQEQKEQLWGVMRNG